LENIQTALKTSIFILKLVIPFYILADSLIYFHILEKIAFLFTPFTDILSLPSQTALALAAGMILNIYASIAFAVPLNLTPYEWTILGLFIGIAHALPLENSIMKKIGLFHTYSTILRILGGFLAVFIFQSLPIQMDLNISTQTINVQTYNSFLDMFINSLYNAFILAIKIIFLISILIFVMGFIKTKLKTKKINISFSIITGLILGITYGAGILIKEKDNLSKNDIFFVGTFLMICHSLIEDVALFVIFGANIWVLILIRLFLAIILSYLLLKIKTTFFSSSTTK